MKKFNTKQTKGEWITHPDDKEVQIKIRPFSLFSITKIPSADNVDMSEVWNIFNYSVIGWRGLENEDGPMDCNEANKKLVYDFDQDLVVFVTSEAATLRDKVVGGKDLKNSSTSQPGATKKQDKK